jgi:hypothetical protein
MHDHRNGDPAREEDREDWAVLALLLRSDAPLTIGEIERAIDDPIAVADAAARLRRDGLVHRCGECVFASRAARRFDAIHA